MNYATRHNNQLVNQMYATDQIRYITVMHVQNEYSRKARRKGAGFEFWKRLSKTLKESEIIQIDESLMAQKPADSRLCGNRYLKKSEKQKKQKVRQHRLWARRSKTDIAEESFGRVYLRFYIAAITSTSNSCQTREPPCRKQRGDGQEKEQQEEGNGGRARGRS